MSSLWNAKNLPEGSGVHLLKGINDNEIVMIGYLGSSKNIVFYTLSRNEWIKWNLEILQPNMKSTLSTAIDANKHTIYIIYKYMDGYQKRNY